MLKCSFCSQVVGDDTIISGTEASICSHCLELCRDVLLSKSLKANTKQNTLLFPKQIVEELDQYVIGQSQAKKVLGVAVYSHILKSLNKSKVKIQKSNILLIGPTGTGKTLLAQSIADAMGLPIGFADATTLTEAGYVGADVESILTDLVRRCGDRYDLAENGIVFIDEIDKISQDKSPGSRDVTGEGVQRGLLKILEGTKCLVPVGNKQKIEIDTTNILFICAGAFSALDEQLVQKRGTKPGIGFLKEEKKECEELDKLRAQISIEDLVQFGFMPEFIGRIPVIVTLNALTKDDLIKIIKEPKNSILSQMKELFALSGKELVLSDTILEEIADHAIARNTGARGVRATLEKLLLDKQYDITSTGKEIITIDSIPEGILK